jgi:hypothetical protein
MKVDWPRKDHRSRRPGEDAIHQPISALEAGTKLPICAIKTIKATCRMWSRLTGHVWPCDDRQPQLLSIQVGIVRHKFFLCQVLIEDRVPSIADHEPQRPV